MNTQLRKKEDSGSTIVIALLTTLVLSAFVGLAVDYTSNIGRNAERDRTFNNAVEIGDGCLELAFASWRKISKTKENPPTSDFAAMPTPSPSNFPSFPSAVVSNFKVQAVDPMVTLASDNPPVSALTTTELPPKTTGPGTGTFSYFYLATADVTLPHIKGTLTAKVRRIFEKRYTSAWNWAILYNDDLELHPNSSLTLNGWVHSNKNIYIGTGSTDSAVTPVSNLTLTDRITYAGNYNIGYSPLDPDHSAYTNVVDAVTPADLPPGKEQNYAPLGWDPNSFNITDTNNDNDGYHEMIEKPATPYVAGTPAPTGDPFKEQRLYNQASIVVEVSATNVVTVYQGSALDGSRSTAMTSQPSGGGSAKRAVWDAVAASVSTNISFQDNREGATVRVVNFDVANFMTTYGGDNYKGWNGIIHITDTSGSASTKRAVRILNGAKVPPGGITVVSNNPVYIQGDFNSGRTGTGTGEPGSNDATPNPEDPEAGTYKRQPASVMADAITLLSNSWNDANAGLEITNPAKIASNTTVNAALVAGNVPSDGVNYSGGAQNFVRFLENWTDKSFTYYGSMLGLYASKQALGAWGDTACYLPGNQKWYFDTQLSIDSSGNPVSVPGYVSTVAYLQQQRWYLQY
jgi:hypothetical protein